MRNSSKWIGLVYNIHQTNGNISPPNDAGQLHNYNFKTTSQQKNTLATIFVIHKPCVQQEKQKSTSPAHTTLSNHQTLPMGSSHLLESSFTTAAHLASNFTSCSLAMTKRSSKSLGQTLRVSCWELEGWRVGLGWEFFVELTMNIYKDSQMNISNSYPLSTWQWVLFNILFSF